MISGNAMAMGQQIMVHAPGIHYQKVCKQCYQAMTMSQPIMAHAPTIRNVCKQLYQFVTMLSGNGNEPNDNGPGTTYQKSM